ncbi:MAG TPA: hypothetical protein VN893_06165 [Bryobacteraceae bacterium]|nr:hypothetical protein [Bryobacteraceae bacterium]
MRIMLVAFLSLMLISCGGDSTAPTAPAPISISLSASALTAPQDGTAASVTVTVQRPDGNTNAVTLSVTPVLGLTAQIAQPAAGTTGQVTFNAAGATAGPHSVTIGATDGQTSATASLLVDVAVVATVKAATNTAAGFNGMLQNFMATSFQPADWDYLFFQNNPGAAAPLSTLGAQHIRLQPVFGGTPQKADQSWDFTMLDAILDPVIATGDKSPELQLAVAPSWMTDSSGHLMPAHFTDFASYAANVVKYYNTTTGFTDSQGISHVHSASNPTPITWWGIFNEPNINGLEPADYLNLYNTVVPAMLAAGSTVPIKFVAVELSDWGSEPQRYLPTFVNGVTAQVDAIGTHYYSSCNQRDLDTALFASIPTIFVPHVQYIYQQLKSVPKLAGVPVWVTENNVNADFAGANGQSQCNPGQNFVTDPRGTSAFFAAWRPYLFSQLGQAGIQSLYQWDFDADAQSAEVDYVTGKTYLSYWVDYYLTRYFPFCDPGAAGCFGSGSAILQSSTTEQSETQSVELLATRNADNSVVVMVSDHAVNAASDNNGTGQERTVMVDVSALGPFSSGTQLVLDAATDSVAGPAAANFAPASQMTLRLGGYGTTFLTLRPGAAHARPAAALAEAPWVLEAVGPAPPAISMTVAPATIALGHSARFAWSATNASSCSGSDILAGAQALKNSMSFAPMLPGSYTATLTCTGVGGTVTQSAEVTVNVL